MIVAVDKDDPSIVYGYNAKRARFYRGAGCIYQYRGKQKPTMINHMINEVTRMTKCDPRYAYEYRKTYHGKRYTLPKNYYFMYRKHLAKNLDIKIIHISSDKCDYCAVEHVKGSWWPMARIVTCEQAKAMCGGDENLVSKMNMNALRACVKAMYAR